MSKPHVHEAFHPERAPMPKSQASQAEPCTTPRGPMPNDQDEDHDQAATDHPTGEPMPATTTTTTNPNDPNRVQTTTLPWKTGPTQQGQDVLYLKQPDADQVQAGGPSSG